MNPLTPNRPMNDSDYMIQAIALAEQGRGFTSPNPMVGAVVVRDHAIVGRGWHRAAGQAHAEVEAIDDAGDLARGSDLYVTLEPCNHFGKTPPCTRKIIAAGIRRVVVGTQDPNPFVAGGGIQELRAHGIVVETYVCRDEAETLIEDFSWYVNNGRKPFVILKTASTLDGRIATRGGDSKWITSPASRAHVHAMRHGADAILVGAGTLRTDNPSLTARIPGKETRDPLRVILDPRLTIDETARVLTQSSTAGTLIATSDASSGDKRARLEALGAKVAIIPEKEGLLDLDVLVTLLGGMGVMSLMIEGGSRVVHSVLKAALVNKVCCFIAPKFLGGDDGIPLCRGQGPEFMKDAMGLRRVTVHRFEDDIMIQGYLK
ncbi:MAG: bifunctional diaminohydroxyphosphoribosylaminopyrimidine deaminase/5-amino-6-(5-phosphoribosylamino)uracil reductase RibD [Pseudomonadota bacterium]